MSTTSDGVASALACPACGNDGRAGVLRYAVLSVAAADIIAVRHGVAELARAPEAASRSGSTRPRVECRGLREDGRICGHTFELPISISGITWKVRA